MRLRYDWSGIIDDHEYPSGFGFDFYHSDGGRHSTRQQRSIHSNRHWEHEYGRELDSVEWRDLSFRPVYPKQYGHIPSYGDQRSRQHEDGYRDRDCLGSDTTVTAISTLFTQFWQRARRKHFDSEPYALEYGQFVSIRKCGDREWRWLQ